MTLRVARRAVRLLLSTGMLGVLVVGCTSSDEVPAGSDQAAAVNELGGPSSNAVETRGPSAPDAVAAGERIVEVAGLRGPTRRCVSLRISSDERAISAMQRSSDEVVGAAAELVEECERAATMVDRFLTSATSEDISDDGRRCLRDLFLTMTPEASEAVVAAAANPTGPGSSEAIETFTRSVEGCR